MKKNPRSPHAEARKLARQAKHLKRVQKKYQKRGLGDPSGLSVAEIEKALGEDTRRRRYERRSED